MQPFPAEPAEPAEPTNILTDPAYRANNDPPGCSISLVIQGRGATERGHFVVDFGAVQVASVLSYRGTTSHAGAYQEARIAAWTWHDHAETAAIQGPIAVDALPQHIVVALDDRGVARETESAPHHNEHLCVLAGKLGKVAKPVSLDDAIAELRQAHAARLASTQKLQATAPKLRRVK